MLENPQNPGHMRLFPPGIFSGAQCGPARIGGAEKDFFAAFF